MVDGEEARGRRRLVLVTGRAGAKDCVDTVLVANRILLSCVKQR